MITLNNLYHITLTGGIHAILFIIIITIIYFSFIVQMKRDIISDFLVKGAKEYNLNQVDISKFPGFLTFMEKLKSESIREQETFQEHNQALVMKACKLILSIIVIYIIFMTIMPIIFKLRNMTFDYYKLLKEVGLIIIIVGLFEILFIKYIILK